MIKVDIRISRGTAPYLSIVKTLGLVGFVGDLIGQLVPRLGYLVLRLGHLVLRLGHLVLS